MPDRRGSRFILEVLFLVGLAVALTLAKLRPLEIAGVMLLGWLIVAILEWAALAQRTALRKRAAASLVRPEREPPAGPAARAGPGGGREPQRDEAATWIASPALRADVLGADALRAETLGEWPHAVPAPAESGDADADPWTVVALPAAPLGEPEPEPEPDRARRGRRGSTGASRAAVPSACPGAVRTGARRATASIRSETRQFGGGSAGVGRSPRPRSRSRRAPREPARCPAGRPPGIDAWAGRMRPHLAVREVALAGLALLAAAVSLAVTAQTRDDDSTSPQPEGSYVALAGSSGPAAFGRSTACGGVLGPTPRASRIRRSRAASGSSSRSTGERC